MWAKGSPCALTFQFQVGAATVENSVEKPQEGGFAFSSFLSCLFTESMRRWMIAGLFGDHCTRRVN